MNRFGRNSVIFSALLVVLLVSETAPAAVYQVPGEVPTIQAGIDAAASGDTVLVACGTYLEHDLIMKAGITLIGESAEPDCVVIDAQGLGRVMDCVDLVPQARLENLTFTGGYTVDGWFTALGGGVRCLTSELSVINCTFRQNQSRIGAGFGASESTLAMADCKFDSNSATHFDWAAGGAMWARDCTGTIDNCQVKDNSAFSENAGNPGDGGGFFFNNSHILVNDGLFQGNSTGAGAGGFYSVTTDSSIFTNCEFIANVAGNGGAVYFEYSSAAQLNGCVFFENIATAGGAIVSFNQSFPRLVDCIFQNNLATQWGGGAVDAWSSQVFISGCTFIGNSAQTHGGGASFGDCTVTLENSVFQDNTAQLNGGAVRGHYSSITAIGCTLVGNSAVEGGGIYCGTSSSAVVERSIIAFSVAGESMTGLVSGYATVSCSDFFGNAGGDWVGELEGMLIVDGNMSQDPWFCGAAEGDFSLAANSPCLPENSGGCDNIGALGQGCGVSFTPEDLHPLSVISEIRAFPNPFNPCTTICFATSRETSASVAIFDLGGRLVRTLLDGPLSQGEHSLSWDGKNDYSRNMPTGVYFYRISLENQSESGRITLIK
jgi:hypothetical protein